VWHDFAWIGEESRTAAQAARCAGQQRKFWEYHDYLYHHQRGTNRGQFAPASLKQFASELGLDRAAFDACLDQGADLPDLQQLLAQGRAEGITATPTFVVNGRRIAGAQSINQIAALLDAELACVGQ